MPPLDMLVGADPPAKQFNGRIVSAALAVKGSYEPQDRAACVGLIQQRLDEVGAKTDHRPKLLRLVSDSPVKGGRSGKETGEEGGCIVSYCYGAKGEKHTRVRTNFTARIVARIIEDDESGELKRKYKLKVTSDAGVQEMIEVPATEFDDLSWLKNLNKIFAYVEAGAGTANEVRATICRLSGKPPRRRQYGHTGWRKHKKKRLFLHGGGAIGAQGPVKGVRVRLDETLADYNLVKMPKESTEWDGTVVSGDQVNLAIQASLGILEVMPPRIAFPALAATYSAALGNAHYSIILYGITGAAKTSYAALMQQHYGYALDNENTPFSADSTSNAVQELLYLAKDVIALVDDYVESGTPTDIHRARRDMGRTLRAKANRNGRARLRSDSTLRKGRPPRALPVYSGEQHAVVKSVLARAINLEVREGDVNWDKLTQAQQNGKAGLFVQSMAAFIQDVAGHYDEVQSQLREKKTENRLRSSLSRRSPCVHSVHFRGERWK